MVNSYRFQPTAARRAFPCYDEPFLKATFGITLISRADTVNLSNMSVASETLHQPSSRHEDLFLGQLFASLSLKDKELDEEWMITKFETTPPVSNAGYAYLLLNLTCH